MPGISMFLNDDIYIRLKVYVARNRTTMTNLVSKLVKEFLDANDKEIQSTSQRKSEDSV